jgi:hypothetical protein
LSSSCVPPWWPLRRPPGLRSCRLLPLLWVLVLVLVPTLAVALARVLVPTRALALAPAQRLAQPRALMLMRALLVRELVSPRCARPRSA